MHVASARLCSNHTNPNHDRNRNRNRNRKPTSPHARPNPVPEYLKKTRSEFEAASSCIARTTGKHALGRHMNVTHFGNKLRTVGSSPPLAQASPPLAQAKSQAQAQAAAYRYGMGDNAMV